LEYWWGYLLKFRLASGCINLLALTYWGVAAFAAALAF
jgi:hypothetical protein